MPLESEPLDWALDDDGDLDVVEGDARWARGLEGVAQGIRLRLSIFKGEWFLDTTLGMPWRKRVGVVEEDAAILGGKYDDLKARTAIREAILDTEDDLEIVSLTTSFDSATRQLSISWIVRVSFSDTPIEDDMTIGA